MTPGLSPALLVGGDGFRQQRRQEEGVVWSGLQGVRAHRAGDEGLWGRQLKAQERKSDQK